MIVLGIDTSGYANAVGIVDGNSVLADRYYEARNDSLEKILPVIDAALNEAGISLEAIDGIGVGLGPGSWTGIRVGVTVAKILAFAAGKPVSGVSSLEVLAESVNNPGKTIYSVISAGTPDTVYAAGYHRQNGDLIMTGDYYVGDLGGLLKIVEKSVVFVGSGLESYGELVGGEIIDMVPRGVAVARLAQKRLDSGHGDDVLDLKPLYLKESTARAFVNKYALRMGKAA